MRFRSGKVDSFPNKSSHLGTFLIVFKKYFARDFIDSKPVPVNQRLIKTIKRRRVKRGHSNTDNSDSVFFDILCQFRCSYLHIRDSHRPLRENPETITLERNATPSRNRRENFTRTCVTCHMWHRETNPRHIGIEPRVFLHVLPSITE